MAGQQAYIYQKNNRLPDATITASISPSTKPPLIYPITKNGNGNIRIYGNYEGALDAIYEVKILDTALEVPIVSAPLFYGAGSGKISDIVVSGLQAQKIKILCVSTGTDTTNAEVEIEGLRFRAKQAGSAGNAIYIIVDDSPLEFEDTDYSLIKELNAGDTGLEGQEWDFDTKALQGEVIPLDAHRIAFGLDYVHIYLQYKKFEDGKWKYYFIQPIQYAVPAGTKVKFVTYGRIITVTNGVTTEVYDNIITIADFWQKIKISSSLIEPVSSAIDTSRVPSSPAVREFTTQTNAYYLPPYAESGSSEYAGELESIAVNNTHTKTELIEIRCKDNTTLGDEVWAVKGSSNGEMGEAVTGELFVHNSISFKIPQKFPEDFGEAHGEWGHTVHYASRDEGVALPPICFDMQLGINAVPQTLTLTYRKKPATCFCPDINFSESCLGLEEKGGETGVAYTVPDLVYWTDVQVDMKIEDFVNYEHREGRSGTSVPQPLTLYNTAKSAVQEYANNFKTLAQRIMDLPEDDTARLESMVSAFKSLVAGLSIGSWYSYNVDGVENAYITDVTYNTTNYFNLVEEVLDYEKTYGVKKNSQYTGTCYTEINSEYYWEVSGEKAYLPAFTDIEYYSTIKSGEEYVNTKEFAFNISTPCGGALIEGDQIVVTINSALYERTYQVGDIIYLPTIAAQNLYLTGGIDGDDTYTFEVMGEINSFPDYSLDRNNPQRYYHQNLQFQIEDGIIPFQVGDYFEFAVEGGHFVWRKDNGSWSSPYSIQLEIQTFDSGLSIGFDFGVSPSFVQNDTWQILCFQENKVENLVTPWSQKWKGVGNLVFSFASQVTIDALIIDMHNLTDTITFQASNKSDFSELEHNEVITVSDLICKLYLDENKITAKYFRLLITGEHSIGYIFLGNVIRLSLDADAVRPLKRYQMSRQETFSLYKYLKQGFTVEYNSFIIHSDFQKLDEMFQYLKSNNDMPFYFIANINYPAFLCIRGWIDTDNIEPSSDIDLNAPEDNRIYSLSFPVVGIK